MIYEVNSNDPKEGILMSDKNNNVMMNNDMNYDQAFKRTDQCQLRRFVL